MPPGARPLRSWDPGHVVTARMRRRPSPGGHLPAGARDCSRSSGGPGESGGRGPGRAALGGRAPFRSRSGVGRHTVPATRALADGPAVLTSPAVRLSHHRGAQCGRRGAGRHSSGPQHWGEAPPSCETHTRRLAAAATVTQAAQVLPFQRSARPRAAGRAGCIPAASAARRHPGGRVLPAEAAGRAVGPGWAQEQGWCTVAKRVGGPGSCGWPPGSRVPHHPGCLAP